MGNICRSPLAEGIAREYGRSRDADIVFDSAGTGNWHVGKTPCENSIRIAAEYGIDISGQRARVVKRDDFKIFDYIIALDSSNVAALKEMGAKRILKLGDFGAEGEDIPDPYFFEGFEGFSHVYTMIERCVHALFAELEQKGISKASDTFS